MIAKGQISLSGKINKKKGKENLSEQMLKWGYDN